MDPQRISFGGEDIFPPGFKVTTLDEVAEEEERENEPDNEEVEEETPLKTVAKVNLKVRNKVFQFYENENDASGGIPNKPTYSQAARLKLTEKEKNELYMTAVKCTQAKYDFTTLDVNDEKRLDDLYNLSMLVSSTRDHHTRYDMDDVFLILFPDTPGMKLKPKVVDLYTHYSDVTVEQVAKSCEYYRKYTIPDFQRDNLDLTFQHLQNCMSVRLFHKTFERYESFPDVQKGGPLLFIIMINQLISDSEDAVNCLKKMVSTLKIRDLPGENVPKVISLVRGAYKYFRFLKRVPDNFMFQVVQVMQTSTVDRFNSYFLSVENNYRLNLDMAKKQDPDYDRKAFMKETLDVELILGMAERLYNELNASQTWTGNKTKGKAAAFVGDATTGRRPPVCWNCNETGHSAHECTKPRNPTVYHNNRKKFNQERNNRNNNKNSKSGDKPTTSSTKQPTAYNGPPKYRPAEDGENNRRVIDGKHMFYNKRTGQWVLDSSHHTNKKPAPTTVAANTSQLTSPQATTTQQPNRAALDVALANTSRAIDTALRGLVNQFAS